MTAMEKPELKARKLLVASVGVATLSYVTAGQGCSPVANLVAGPGGLSDAEVRPDSPIDIPIANLVAPPVDVRSDVVDARDAFDARPDIPIANLVAPPVDVRSDAMDAPPDGDGADAVDSSIDTVDENPADGPSE